jgi:hypothetical protein
MNTHKTTMLGVTEYGEKLPVSLMRTEGVAEYGVPRERWIGRGNLVIYAENEAGHGSTEVDLVQLIEWLRANHPELLMQ